MSPLAAAGLILDVAGAIALAAAFAFKRPKDIRVESGSYWDFNATLLVSLSKQTADAWVGGALLVLGFLAQFVANVWEDDELSLWLTLPSAGAIAVASLALLRWVIRPWNVRRTIEFLLRDLHRDKWRPLILAIGRVVLGERRDGETPAELGQRLLGQKRWSRVTAGKELQPELFHF